MSEDGLLGVAEKFERAFGEIEKLKLEKEKYEIRFRDIEKEVGQVKGKVEWQGREIQSIMEDIKDIHSDTRWLRRTITGAIIAAVSTGLIGGFIGVLWTLVGK